MSQVLDQMRKDNFKAVKDHDDTISGIIQLVMASAKNVEIEKGEKLTDDEVVDVIRRESKKLQDSIDQFSAGGREDLADIAKKQKEYTDQFLPQMMEREEIVKVVEKVISDTGADSMSDMGKVMGQSMSQLQGEADGAVVKDVVTEMLS